MLIQEHFREAEKRNFIFFLLSFIHVVVIGNSEIKFAASDGRHEA
jgi:hypothetical protein